MDFCSICTDVDAIPLCGGGAWKPSSQFSWFPLSPIITNRGYKHPPELALKGVWTLGQQGFRVQPLLLCIQRMHGRLRGEVFLECPTGRRLQSRPRKPLGDYGSRCATKSQCWETVGDPWAIPGPINTSLTSPARSILLAPSPAVQVWNLFELWLQESCYRPQSESCFLLESLWKTIV